ncbi:hypothetical protein HY642_01540 [Candidatus Woesearchaeota archaeon]|nr:hypothetical protein [Candidatus Woesearchaeota archaeon]
MATSVLGNVLTFLAEIGVYDVVLPFLLVFTVVFAILEKTKIFGVDELKEGDKTVKYPKKNLNAMAAFVIAFFVIASARLVETITQVSGQMVVLLFLSVFFLLLVGSLYKEGEFELEKGPWRATFTWISFLGIVAIFLNAIKDESGKTYLDIVIDWFKSFWTSTGVAAIIMMIVFILLIRYITTPYKAKEEKKEEKKKE